MSACASIFVKVFYNPFQGIFSTPKIFVDSPLPPTYNLLPEYPLVVDAVPFGSLIAEFPRTMFSLSRNTKRKLMVGVAFVLFVPTEIERDGGS